MQHVGAGVLRVGPVERGHELVGRVERAPRRGGARSRAGACERRCRPWPPARPGRASVGSPTMPGPVSASRATASVQSAAASIAAPHRGVVDRAPSASSRSPVGGVALAGDGPGRTAAHDLAGRHLVEGEGAGLVGADHRWCEPSVSTECEPLDDGVAAWPCWRDADGEGDGDDGGQALGDGGDGEGHRAEGGVGEVGRPGPSAGRRPGRRRRRRSWPGACRGGRAGAAAGSRRPRRRRAARRPCPSRCAMPVAVTTSSARPRTTVVFMNTTEWRSPRGDVGAGRRAGVLLDRDGLAGEGRLVDRRGWRPRPGGRRRAPGRRPRAARRRRARGRRRSTSTTSPPRRTRTLDDEHLLERGQGVGRPWPPGRSRARR